MIDGPDGRARRPISDVAARRAERDAQHQVLADLLGAYADGALPAESAARVEAHLVGCGRCRGDVAMQAALRDRLAAEPVLPASAALRARIAAAVAQAPAPAVLASAGASAVELLPPPADQRLARVADGRRRAVGARIVTAAALGAALLAGGVAWWRVRAAPPRATAALAAGHASGVARVPLVAAALADYRRVAAGDLPGRARDLDAVRAATALPVEPLRAPGVRLLGAWTTTLDDEAAAVLAYRYDDRLIVHYIVSEALFFRYSALRAAAAVHQPVAVADGPQALLAWSEATTGALLVSDDTPARLAGVVPPVPFARPTEPPAMRRP